MLERSDVVQVSMSDQNSSDILFVLDQIRNVRDDIIHTMHLYRSKLDTRIYDDDIVLVFDDGHIDTNLLKTSERNDLYRNLILLDKGFRILDDSLGQWSSMTQKRFRCHSRLLRTVRFSS